MHADHESIACRREMFCTQGLKGNVLMLKVPLQMDDCCLQMGKIKVSGYLEQVDEGLGKVAVLAGAEEGGRDALLAGAARAADAVDVRLDVARQIIIDDVRHVGNVQAARGHVGRHQDRLGSAAELLQRLHACTCMHRLCRLANVVM